MKLISNLRNNELQKEFENFMLDKREKVDDIICSIVYDFARESLILWII